MISVLIVDDHPVIRHGVALMLQAHDDIRVVSAVSSADEAVRTVLALAPHVVLMDLSMPGRDGTSATREIVDVAPNAAVVVLTSFSDWTRIQEALDAGAVGYMLKDSEPRDLVEAVRSAARGESPLHPKAARVALTRRAAPSADIDLTVREAEVLRLVSRGMTNGQIGRRLGIAERTVKGHLTRVFARVGVTDRTSAAVWAQRHLDPRSSSDTG